MKLAPLRRRGDALPGVSGVARLDRRTLRDIETVQALMIEAKSGLSSQLEAFAVNTAEFMTRERRLLLDGEGIPDIKTRFAGKHAVIVVRGHDHQRDLKSLKHYIREYKPVLVG